jgi:hypothetical protein
MRRTLQRARHVRRYAALLIVLACGESSTAPTPANSTSDASGAKTTITATPTSLTVGGSANLVVQAKTASGANITAGGAVVTLSSDAGTLSAVTDAGDGTYTARLTSIVERDAHVTGTIDGSAITQHATVSFTPGPPPTRLVSVAGDGQAAAVGTSVAVAPAVRATDNAGKPVAGVTVTFAVVSGGGSITGGTTTTNADGTATVGSWAVGVIAGTNVLSATAGGLITTFTATGTGGVPAAIAKTAGDAQTAPTGTRVAIAPAVLIVDKSGVALSGVPVTFAVVSGGGSIAGATAVTGADGVASVGAWTLGNTVGPNTLTATAGVLSATFSASGVAGPAGTPAKVAGTDNQSTVVGTVIRVAPSVKITDANNNPVTGLAVTFAVASGGGSITGGSTKTDAGGIATLGSWTLGLKAGINTLTVTANGLGTTFTATGTAGAVTQLQLLLPGETAAPATTTGKTGTPTAETAGTPFTVVVNAVDVYWNVVTNATPTVHFASNDPLTATLPADLALVAGTHTYTTGVTLKTAAALATISATATALGSAQSTVVVGAGALHHFVVQTAAGAAIGNQVAGVPFPIKITAQDADSNTATTFGGTVALTTTNSTFSGGTVTTTAPFIKGVLASQSVALVLAGSNVSITATNTSGSESGTNTPGFTVTAGALNHFAVEAAAGGAIANQVAGTPFAIKITAQDASSNTLTSFTGTAAVSTTNSAFATGTPTTTANFVSGTITIPNLTLTKAANTVSIAARNSAATGETGTSATFTVAAAAASQLQLLLPGELAAPATASGKTGTPAGATAGKPFTVIVNAVDANWNVVIAAAPTVHFAASVDEVSPVLPQDAPLVGGTHTYTSGVTLKTVTTTATLTASSTGLTSSTSPNVAVTASTADHFLVEAAGGGGITSQTAGAAFAIKVTAQDVNNNTATAFASTVTLTVANSSFTGGAATVASGTFINGVLASQTVTLTKAAGGVTIVASNATASGTSQASAPFTVVPGALHHFAVLTTADGAIGNQVAGSPFPVKITAQDVNNNTVTSYTGSVTLTAANSVISGSAPTPNFVAGVLASHNVTLTLAANNASLTATNGVIGKSALFNVTPGAATQLQLLLPGETAAPATGSGKTGSPLQQQAGKPFTVIVNAVDANFNLVSSASPTVHFAASVDQVAPLLPADAAFSGGTHTYTNGVTLKTVSTSTTVTATDAGGTLSQSASPIVTVTVGGFNHFAVTSSGAALGNQTAGSAFPVTLTAQDAGNNIVPTFTGNVTLTANNSLFSGGSATTTAGPFVAGTFTLPSVVLTRASSGVSLTATNTLSGGETGTSAAVVVAPAAATKLQLLLPGETGAPGTIAGKTGAPTATNAVSPFTVIVNAVDPNWNVVAAATPTIHFTSNDAQATLPPDAALAAGTRTYTTAAALKTATAAATATITASDVAAALAASTSAGVLVNSGALDHFLVQAAVGGAIGDQVAGTPFAIRITAQDVNNTTVASFNGTVTLTATNSAISSGTTTATFTNGVLASQNVTLSAANTGVFITATSGTQSGASGTFNVTAGSLHHFAIVTAGGAPVGNQVAGSPFAVKITAQDVNNNTVTSFTNAVALTAANSVISSGTPTAAFVAGVLASQNVTLALAASNVSLTATNGVSGTSAAFTVIPGAVASFVVKSTSDGPIGPQAANTPFNIKITALDASQNVVTSFNSGVTLTSSGTLTGSPFTSSSFTNGVLASQSVTITSVGTFNITASDGTHIGTSNSFAVAAALAVSSTSPTDGQSLVSPSTTIVFNFNRSVTATTGSFTIKCPSTGSAVSYSVSGSSSTAITLTPSSSLPAGTACQVTAIGAQISDVNGFHLSGDFILNFTVN